MSSCRWLPLQELTQDKDELQRKVCEQLKQLTQLRSQLNDLVTLSSAAAGHLAVDVERPAGVDELHQKVAELSGTLEVRDKEVECVCLYARNNAFVYVRV